MRKLFTTIAVVLLSASVFAQTPQKMSYQAVIRNSSGALVANQEVGIQISILQSSTNGTAVYVETHAPTTNANGLVSIEIGDGTIVSGSFTTINWANDTYFIKTETDPTGGTIYSITGISQLLSVPYALHAQTAETLSGGVTESDPVFGAWDKSTGISITESQISDLGTYVATESDPVYNASQAGNITATDITNLANLSGINTGDQDLSGIATNTQAIQDTAAQIRANIPDVSGFVKTETDPMFGLSIASGITCIDTAKWNSAATKHYVDSLFADSDLKSLTLAISQGADLATLISSPFYSISDLLFAGASANDLYVAGASVDSLHANGITVSSLLSYGATVQELSDSNIDAEYLLGASISVADLLNAGMSGEELYNGGASIADLYNNGIPISDFINWNVSASDMVAANIPVVELINSNVPINDLIAAGVTIHLLSGSGVDQDNNSFNWVGMGEQVWMTENLKVTHYQDGTEIPYVEDTTQWINTTSAAYCWAYNDVNYKDTWGALYNFYTIESNNVCPNGWHVPTYAEYEEMVAFLDSEGNYTNYTGTALQATTGWLYGANNDCGGTDVYGFKALPAGIRDRDGLFNNVGRGGAHFHTSTIADFSDFSHSIYEGKPIRFYLTGGCISSGSSSPALLIYGSIDKVYGQSVRCIKD